ncbi:glycosyltransferase [Nocardioides sp. AX2bis]|uniref:glycosyltransferase n=1 Tax=Nocardioides sp. AX2bis TaxID=2653157 RepID=UPI0012F2E9F3|nr:glycosyltransferase [Nocardioides sp. AX2bis]VXB11529.1 Glycosyltransferase, GT2 family [Nocardioides sp. AX2bis]
MPAPASVAVLLVSHDGERWLPTVLDGLAAQDRVGRVVGVDTGSKDASASLVEAALAQGPLRGEVVRAGPATSFPDAVQTGLDRLAATGEPPEWIWVLHDDATPAPGALDALLAAAAEHPEADLLGPKLREWPSLRRLLELGVTISGTGQRETGLERGEYDQGQHDELREVLAVNTAGMLVRRRLLEELGGLDPALPVFGNDLDLGWRAAAAGRTTLVVPQAVVFHAEAAHRGARRTPLTGRHTHYQERRAALYTLLVNAPARRLPLMVVRLALGTLLRMLGLVLVRAVGEALDDLAALLSVLSSPGELRAARRARTAARGGRAADEARVSRLRAPFWVPYRHGLDVVSDLASALTVQASDVAERRRAATAAHDPSSMAARRAEPEDDDQALADNGVLVRLLTTPIAVLLVAVVVGLLVAGRAGLGSVSGGVLSPAPESVGAWWSLYAGSWLPLGQGTAVPAPAYVLPLALLGTLLTPTGAVSALLVLAAPLALWGAWRLLRVVGRLASPRGASRWLLLAGSTTYALVPLTSGAWGEGRLGPVVAAVLMPWAAHACLGFADPDPDRRWRAAWRSGLLLALACAFAPVTWFAALLLGVVVLALSAALAPRAVRERSAWGPPAAALGAVPVLLLPWWLPLLVHGGAAGLLLEAGAPVTDPSLAPDGPGALLGRVGAAGAVGAPAWLGVVLLVLGLAALLPRRSRVGVLVCWLVAAVVAGTAALVALVPLTLDGVTVAPGLGALVVLWQGCLVTAAVLGGQGLLEGGSLRAGETERPRPVVALAAAVAVAALAVPLGGMVWAVLDGQEELVDDPGGDIPAYMLQSAATGPEHGILLVRGSIQEGLRYTVVRDDGATVGEDEVLALASEDTALTGLVQELVSAPTPAVVAGLAEDGVEYVVLPAPVDGRVAAGLDATSGLAQASAEDRSTRAWQVERALDPDAVSGSDGWWRPVLLVVQALAVLAVLVLAAPTTREARR